MYSEERKQQMFDKTEEIRSQEEHIENSQGERKRLQKVLEHYQSCYS